MFWPPACSTFDHVTWGSTPPPSSSVSSNPPDALLEGQGRSPFSLPHTPPALATCWGCKVSRAACPPQPCPLGSWVPDGVRTQGLHPASACGTLVSSWPQSPHLARGVCTHGSPSLPFRRVPVAPPGPAQHDRGRGALRPQAGSWLTLAGLPFSRWGSTPCHPGVLRKDWSRDFQA